MPVIEGEGLKPCESLYYRTDRDGRCISLMTRCSHPMFELGCLDGRGNCEDYRPAKRVTSGIKYIASQIEARH